VVLRENIDYFSELFIELGDAFFEKSMYSDALPIYERVMKSGKVFQTPLYQFTVARITSQDISVNTVMNLATCHQFNGNLAEAEEMYSLGRPLLL
jgi:hypothetical protein